MADSGRGCSTGCWDDPVGLEGLTPVMSDSNPAVPLLAVRQVGKQFPGVAALTDVSFDVHPAEVLAIIGENGAGKSTLMKILAGVQAPDRGEIRWRGEPVQFRQVSDAQQAGIALIHQELNLADNLDIGANVFLGREPQRWGWIDQREIRRRATELLQRVGLAFDPATSLSRLTLGQQQLVEIAKALAVDARLLIMDEPTSSLSHGETETLFNVVRGLRRQGVSVIYISHRLGEVTELADRCVVLRDGRYVGELERSEISRPRMISLMVGRDLAAVSERPSVVAGPVALELQQVVTRAHPGEAVSLRVHRGEVVGLAGLVGAGRTELLEAVFGTQPAIAGTISVGGRQISVRHPADAIAAGVGLAPEDRKQFGLLLDEGVDWNTSLPRLDRDCWGPALVNERAELRLATESIQRLGTKTPSPWYRTKLLSGGNQQKVVLGKWLATQPTVLLLDEPTRGIDVGAKGEIYRVIDELAQSGLAVLFVSSELEEIRALADRVLVLHEGRIAAELSRSAATEEAIMAAATGTVWESTAAITPPSIARPVAGAGTTHHPANGPSAH